MEYVLATSTADRRRVDSTGREVHVGKPEQQELDVWPANPCQLPWPQQNSSCVLGARPHPWKQNCCDPTELVFSRDFLPLAALLFLP